VGVSIARVWLLGPGGGRLLAHLHNEHETKEPTFHACDDHMARCGRQLQHNSARGAAVTRSERCGPNNHANDLRSQHMVQGEGYCLRAVSYTRGPRRVATPGIGRQAVNVKLQAVPGNVYVDAARFKPTCKEIVVAKNCCGEHPIPGVTTCRECTARCARWGEGEVSVDEGLQVERSRYNALHVENGANRSQSLQMNIACRNCGSANCSLRAQSLCNHCACFRQPV